MGVNIDESLLRKGKAPEILAALLPLIVLSRSDTALRPAVESLLTVLIPPLVLLRDEKHKTLNITVIGEAAGFNKLVGMAYQESLPQEMRRLIIDYLYELPSFVLEAVDENGEKSNDPIYEKLDIEIPRKQHEHLRSFLLKALSLPAAA